MRLALSSGGRLGRRVMVVSADRGSRVVDEPHDAESLCEAVEAGRTDGPAIGGADGQVERLQGRQSVEGGLHAETGGDNQFSAGGGPVAVLEGGVDEGGRQPELAERCSHAANLALLPGASPCCGAEPIGDHEGVDIGLDAGRRSEQVDEGFVLINEPIEDLADGALVKSSGDRQRRVAKLKHRGTSLLTGFGHGIEHS